MNPPTPFTPQGATGAPATTVLPAPTRGGAASHADEERLRAVAAPRRAPRRAAQQHPGDGGFLGARCQRAGSRADALPGLEMKHRQQGTMRVSCNEGSTHLSSAHQAARDEGDMLSVTGDPASASARPAILEPTSSIEEASLHCPATAHKGGGGRRRQRRRRWAAAAAAAAAVAQVEWLARRL